MRVSNATLRNNVMRNINQSLRELSRVQRQMASGRSINQPSDNPVVTAKLLNINAALSESAQFKTNVRDGVAWLDMTDSTLNSIGEVFHRAKDLTLAGANGTMPQDAREYNAREIDQILRHVVTLANSSFDGDRYLFGGKFHGGKPFPSSDSSLNGYLELDPLPIGAGEGQIRYEIIRHIDMPVNVEGRALFVDGGLFDSLIDARDALVNNTGVQEAIEGIDQAMTKLLDTRASVGARQNRLEMTETRYEEEVVTLEQLSSKLGDIDMAEAIMNYNVREHVYHAALAAAARVMQPTLLDYIR